MPSETRHRPFALREPNRYYCLMPPATTRARPPKAPLTGMLWFGARLSLALRRTRRFLQWWIGIGGSVAVVALLLPVAIRAPESSREEALANAVSDSVRTARQLTRAAERAATAESLAVVAQRSTTQPVRTAPSARPATADESLARAIAAARNGRNPDAVLALAAHPTVSAGPRMRATADSFRVAPDASEAYRLSGVIIAMAEYRLRTLGGSVEASPAQAVTPSAADTAQANAILRAERDTAQIATREHEAARQAVFDAQQSIAATRSPVPPVSPGLAMIALVVAGLVLRVALALLRELREPTIAHPLEAERAVGAPALSHVRDGLSEGPLRFRPSGVDPFRVLYLQLTSTGTRERSVIVTGDDTAVIAAVAARLAIAAAADHRTTLVAEWDSEQVALARIFRDQPEPGVSDAMAGSFTWREVARSVGSSDGLSIAMLPAGSTHGEISPERRAESLAAFQRFRTSFEFSIVAVNLRDLEHGRALVPEAPVVLAATIGETPLDALVRNAATAEEGAAPLHSLVLWDAPRPTLLSRAELAAWLSKRKGRTPGGSFRAVQEAITKPPQQQ